MTAQMPTVGAKDLSHAETTDACELHEQSLLWSAYVVALDRTQSTSDAKDKIRAYSAWLDFLAAFLPNERERSQIPEPLLLRAIRQRGSL